MSIVASVRCALALSLAAAVPTALSAQRIAGGVVIAARSGRPIANAEVTVEVGTVRAVTGADGRFLLRELPRDDARLLVRAVGFEPWRGEIHAGDSQLRIALSEVAVKLDEVVTIGTAERAQRRELGNAVTTVDARQVVEGGTVSSVHQLLNGRVPGLALQPASGAVGSGARMTVRGGTSFSLPNEPLLYVDGVRVNNARAAGPINQSSNSRSISSIDDLDPSDIERVEVIKGPSAATLYGTEASSGVINIVTRHGTAGAPRWSLLTRHGVNFIRNGGDVFPVNYQLDSARNVISLDVVRQENERGTPIFHHGGVHEYSLNVSGGTDELRYYGAVDARSSRGVSLMNRLSKQGGRVNLQLTPSSKLTVAMNAGYASGPTDDAVEGGLGGIVWSALMADPRKLPGNGGDSTRRGFFTLLPEEFQLQVAHGGKIERDVGRLTTAVHVDHTPASWFRQRLIVGYDRTNETNVIFVPRVDALLSHQALLAEPFGYKEDEGREIDYRTLDYTATLSLSLPRSLRASTSIGGQYYGTTTSYAFESGRTFPTEGLSSINSTTKIVSDDDIIQNITIGGFVQEQFAWRDRLFLTAAIRTDDNSSFGANFDRVYYPKASLSWVLSDEPFFHAPGVSTLRLRAAYGEAGKQPQAFDALPTFAATLGPLDVPAITPQRVGNPDLGPERGKELEVGADIGALHERLGLELTYYDKRTTNAILERQYAPSGGIPGTQLFNAGAIRNRGFELSAHGTPIRRAQLGWDLTLTVATNSNRVVSLGDDGTPFVTAGTYLRHQVGYPVGAWFEKRVVDAQISASGIPSQILCDDGHVGSMPCYGANGIPGDADDAPSVFLGSSVPRTQGSATTTFSTLHDRLRLYALVDFARGQRKVDLDTQARCTLDGGRCRENFFPLEFDPRRIAGINSSGALLDWFITDASFVKLREVACAYSLPERWANVLRASAATITLSGRELHRWTRYQGLEPEAMYLGGTLGGNYGATEVNMYPQLSQWLLSFSVAF